MVATKKVQKEINSLLKQMADTFAQQDIEKYMTIYVKETDVVIYGSQTGEKWTKLEDYRNSVIEDWKKVDEMIINYNWVSINHSPSEQIAWLAADLTFVTTLGKQQMNIPGRFTAVCIKEQDNWKMIQSHFSMPFTPPPDS
jgi:ketosteroid isomerase-like protein